MDGTIDFVLKTRASPQGRLAPWSSRMKEAYPDPDIQLLLVRYSKLSCWDVPDLAAPYWRLYWCDRRGGLIDLPRETIRLCPKKFYLIPPETHFRSRLCEPFGQLYLHFVMLPHHKESGKVYQIDARRVGLAIAHRLKTLLSASPVPRLEPSLLALGLIHTALAAVPEESFHVHYSDPRVQQIVEYMEHRLSRRMSNADLARRVHMNTNAFTRLFREITGTTPQAYLRRKRIEQACIFLHYTDWSIETIAERVGFSDRYHFTRVFRQHREIGPAGYRDVVDPVIWREGVQGRSATPQEQN